jgi:hypothetical protein
MLIEIAGGTTIAHALAGPGELAELALKRDGRQNWLKIVSYASITKCNGLLFCCLSYVRYHYHHLRAVS